MNGLIVLNLKYKFMEDVKNDNFVSEYIDCAECIVEVAVHFFTPDILAFCRKHANIRREKKVNLFTYTCDALDLTMERLLSFHFIFFFSTFQQSIEFTDFILFISINSLR